jgi:hypothetical protein
MSLASSELNKFRIKLNNPEKTVIAGGCAGVVSKTITAPFARMAILYQINAFATTQRGSLLASGLQVYREEGLASFWKGNLTSCIHRFPYAAINFTTFSLLTTNLTHLLGVKESSLLRLGCGAAAGAVACTVCYPLELIRIRLTVQSSDYYRGILHGLQRVVREEGVSGLYKGLGVSLAVCVPSLAISFSVYGTLKHEVLRGPRGHRGVVRDSFADPAKVSGLNALGSCAVGAVSGLTASFVMFPVDVLRRRLQVRGNRRGGLSLLAKIVRTEGSRALYRGLLPEMLKVAPMVGIQFTIYESILSALGGLNPS